MRSRVSIESRRRAYLLLSVLKCQQILRGSTLYIYQYPQSSRGVKVPPYAIGRWLIGRIDIETEIELVDYISNRPLLGSSYGQ